MAWIVWRSSLLYFLHLRLHGSSPCTWEVSSQQYWRYKFGWRCRLQRIYRWTDQSWNLTICVSQYSSLDIWGLSNLLHKVLFWTNINIGLVAKGIWSWPNNVFLFKSTSSPLFSYYPFPSPPPLCLPPLPSPPSFSFSWMLSPSYPCFISSSVYYLPSWLVSSVFPLPRSFLPSNVTLWPQQQWWSHGLSFWRINRQYLVSLHARCWSFVKPV